MENEKKFWNDPSNIKWFNEQPPPEYWKEFFQDKSRKIKRVLDLGCGAGRNTQLLIELGCDVYACDLFDGMVIATKNRLQRVGVDKSFIDERIIIASMFNLPYCDSFFDAVLSNGVYHNVSSMEEMDVAFKETGRVLKKGGYLCFNLFSSNYIDPSLLKISNHIYLTKEKLPMVLISKIELIAFFSKHGFVSDGEIVEYKRVVSTGKRSIMRGVFKKI